MNESMADRAGEKLADKRVRDLLPSEPQELPAVNHDDTIIEVAAVMARLRCPLVGGDEGRSADRGDQCFPVAAAGVEPLTGRAAPRYRVAVTVSAVVAVVVFVAAYVSDRHRAAAEDC